MNCPYCNTPIEKHEAGRCLDAWVAEAVMGCSPESERTGWNPDGGPTRWMCGCATVEDPYHYPHEGAMNTEGPIGQLAWYSTSIEDAWRVVEKLQGPPHSDDEYWTWGVEIDWIEDGTDHTGWLVIFAGTESPLSSSAPLSICRSAIMRATNES